MQKIEVTAPGKAILHGEHAVVYKKAAIAIGLGLRTRVTVLPYTENIVKLVLNNLQYELQWSLDVLKGLKEHGDASESILPPNENQLLEISKVLAKAKCFSGDRADFIKLSVTIFLYLYMNISRKYGPCTYESFIIAVESDLSIGAGMGSSASYSVCLSAAFLALCGKISQNLSPANIETVSKWAFCAETICHGSPSGIDNSICTHGGALLFKDGKVAKLLPSLPPLKILLVDSGVSRNTKSLVSNVWEMKTRHPIVVTYIMEAINALSLESWDLLQDITDSKNTAENLRSMQELVKVNQHLLNSLGVGHKKLDDICLIASKHGFAGKLTGAGGGGCVVIIINMQEAGEINNISDLKEDLASSGYQFWDVCLGGSGVQISISHVDH